MVEETCNPFLKMFKSVCIPILQNKTNLYSDVSISNQNKNYQSTMNKNSEGRRNINHFEFPQYVFIYESKRKSVKDMKIL